jgi:hypothetical protein
MFNARTAGRLGTLAVGLGFGAAVAAAAATPGIAWADPANVVGGDVVDQLASALAAAPVVSDNFAVSFDGIPLVSDGSAIATSTPGEFGLAIAEGANAVATSTGLFDTAVAGGAGTTTTSAGTFDSASAIGDGSSAVSGGSGLYDDNASVYGLDSDATAIGGNFDTASVSGNDDDATAEFGSGNYASAAFGTHDVATSGGLGSASDLLGNGDWSTILGSSDTAFSGTDAAGQGSYDWAGVFVGESLHAVAQGANFAYDFLPSL